MSFVYLYWAWLLLLLPVFFFFIYRIHLRTREVIGRFFDLNRIENYRPRLRYVLQGTAVLCLLLAILGPYVRTTEEIVSSKRKEVYFVLDVSASMNAQDVSPSRLEKGKDIIRRLAVKLKGERLGIIAFTDYAYVQCPLTQDNDMFQLFLNMLSTRQFGNKGTNFRKALTRVLGRFSEESTETTNRFIVFISDGENYSEGYHSVMQKFKKSGINLVAVGIGTLEGAPIPLTSAYNPEVKSKTPFVEDENGQRVISRLNEPSFKELIRDLNAPYLRVKSGTDVVPEIWSYLNRVSLSTNDEIAVRQNQNLYLWFLAVAFLALTASLFLMPYRKNQS
jgi:Ca-activated chloride channel family protein